MNLSPKAKAMFAIIEKKGGGVISEWKFRGALNISHGTFTNARKELCKAGLLMWRKADDGRAAYYELCDLRNRDRLPEVRGNRGFRLMPVVDGPFASKDEWTTAVALSVDGQTTIDETDAPHVYRVTGDDYSLPRNYYVFPFKNGIWASALMGGLAS